MKNALAVIFSVLLFGIPGVAHACSVCFYGDPTQKSNIALRWAVILLLGVLALLMVFFVKFFVSVGKRSRLSAGKEA
jgi:hypothetical protein